MKVSLIQRSIEWLSPERNRSVAEEWIAKCVGSDLVVLPEVFATGFCLDPEQSAASGAATFEWMKDMAQRHNIHLAGSVAVKDGGNYYNRLYVTHPDGSFDKYDKHHLFTFSGENKHYTAGNQRVVIEIGGVRILLLVCYDLRFPAWIRNRGDYDMILCVSNWARARRSAWDVLLRARAIENVAYVCGVNIVGLYPSCLYSGGTAAIDFRGEVVANVADGELGIATVNLDLAALAKFRAEFPSLDDADDFVLKD